jgi:hypothetical protein
VAAAEQVKVDEAGLRLLVSLAEGSMRDGLSLLDQAIASCEGTIDEEALTALFGLVRSEVYARLDAAILAGDPAAALRLVDELARGGQDLVVFVRGLLTHLRNLLVLKVDPTLTGAVDMTDEQIAAARPFLDRFAEQDVLAMLDRVGLYHDRIHRSTQPRILLEAAMVELCRWEEREVLADLVGRLRRLLASGAGTATGGGSAAAGSAGTRGTGRMAARPDAGAGAASAASAGGASASPSRTAGEAPARPARSAAASAGGAGGWTGFLEATMSRHPGLAACLMDGLPDLDLAAGRLTVSFAPDRAFMLQRLEEGRAQLEAQVAGFFGRPLQVVLQAVDEGAGPSAREHEEVRRAVAPTERETLARECEDDPDLGGLVDLLGGEPLPDAERERWRGPATTPEADPGTNDDE